VIFLLLATLTAIADPLPIFNADTVNALSDTCAAAEDDPSASYVVSNSTTTLYSGDELEPMLTAASVQLLADASELTLTANAAGKAAMLEHHKCMIATAHVPHGVTAWANTAGGFNFYDADIVRDGGDLYDFESIYLSEGRLVMQFALRGATGCDDTVYILGEVSTGGDIMTAHAKWYRPATPADPGFELQTCEGGALCSGTCELQYGPNGAGGAGGDPVYMCLCNMTTEMGIMGCEHGVLPGGAGSFNEPSGWADVDGGGIGDGGMWGGLVIP